VTVVPENLIIEFENVKVNFHNAPNGFVVSIWLGNIGHIDEGKMRPRIQRLDCWGGTDGFDFFL
jgi:hypothetical protein